MVLPLVLDPKGLDWGPGVHAISQKALQTFPQCCDLCPGDILSVSASAFPELDCRMIYLVRLDDDLQWKPKEVQKQAIRNMVQSCLSTFYGSFLESIAFPILLPVDSDQAVMWEWLLILLEEINQFLKNFPNTWMKLVQIRSLPEWILPRPVENCLSFDAETVGSCHMEELLFLQYLEENSSAFHEFQVQLKKAGYAIQVDLGWRLLTFQAIHQPVQLLDLEKSFQLVRKKYVLHCETREEILKVLMDHPRLVKRFKSLRIYILDQMWIVGLWDEINCFLQYLAHEASQRELVSCEYAAEPVLWYTIAKDVALQELLPSNPMIELEIIPKTPATIRFWGSRQRVKEAERRFNELLDSFQILPVPLSDFQLQFVKAHWDKAFYNHFFLERSIPVVLELSEAAQIAGLDLGKMEEAKDFLMKLVCERPVEVAEDVAWATQCPEWKILLQQHSRAHKEVAIHRVSSGWVILVGFCPMIFQVEESIKEYLRENSSVEENMRLTRPELVLAGKDLLHIMGREQLSINVALQVDSQLSVLQVRGLRKYVKKAIPAIQKDLDSLVLDIVPLKRRILKEYVFGIGASLFKIMAQNLGCIVRMKTKESDDWKSIMNEDSIKERFDTGFSEAIYIMGKWNPVNVLKHIVTGLLAQFCTISICHEAIATFKNMSVDEFLSNIFHRFPVDIRWLQETEVQICGFQNDVGNVLEAVHRKIKKYQSEIIEVKAEYKSIPYIVIKESVFQKRFPTSPFVSTEVLANDPTTILFRGPRQKLVNLRRNFEEFFNGFQFLTVSLSELQFQFVKAQWDKLFHKAFFWERNIPAVLEISEIVQVGGFSFGEIKEAEKILMEQVFETTVEIAPQLQWATEEPEWEDMLNRLKLDKEVAIHYTPSSQVTVVGPSLQTAVVEEYIKEYFRDNSPLKESIRLTKPELVLAAERVLHIMNWEHLKVNIKFKQNDDGLYLKVKGLWKFVKKAIPVINKDLDSLVFDMIPLKKKALCIYFSDVGADLLKNMAETQNCIVRMQTQESHLSSNGGALQGLAEDQKAVIHVTGIQSKVTSLKQNLSDFIAKFHKETICSAEISNLADDSLKALCNIVLPQYPVGFHRLREKVVCISGSQKDVENVSRNIYTKLEELVVARVQKDQAEQAISKQLYENIRWHHKSNDRWSAFDVVTNSSLEQAYTERKIGALVQWNGDKLLINFPKAEALIPGKKKIKIRRDIYLSEKNIAPFWEAMDGALVKKVELQTYSKEYQDVVKNFSKTAGRYQIVKVERIQNSYLWISYCWKKSWMENKNSQAGQNELILYHGTLPENCSSVCDIGFKNAFRKQCIYGDGIYFSVAAGCSVLYAKPDLQGLRYVFQARVLAGEYGCGKKNMVLPPMKRDGNGYYDSLVDVLCKPNIFVIFFDDHAYPEYLITFRGHTSSS
ncbi:uncharacterized protein LOC116520662 [Thamnophis elegans]|uniref:uncharacterized protein LOC116520662 n=1 Tax=Thamnophis elegans TaxID=35005 RepID=UPI001377A3F2|nr:uncharacterized protein LOC116520662 [Thamnophis elegans]